MMREKLESRVAGYNTSCFSDFIADVHMFCSRTCLKETDVKSSHLRPIEELCAKNCAKKALNSY